MKVPVRIFYKWGSRAPKRPTPEEEAQRQLEIQAIVDAKLEKEKEAEKVKLKRDKDMARGEVLEYKRGSSLRRALRGLDEDSLLGKAFRK